MSVGPGAPAGEPWEIRRDVSLNWAGTVEAEGWVQGVPSGGAGETGLKVAVGMEKGRVSCIRPEQRGGSCYFQGGEAGEKQPVGQERFFGQAKFDVVRYSHGKVSWQSAHLAFRAKASSHPQSPE